MRLSPLSQVRSAITGKNRFPVTIRQIQVELWLRSLALAESSYARIRNIMSVLFNHGIRHEICYYNPIRLVRQSAKRKKLPAVLSAGEVRQLIASLGLRERTLRRLNWKVPSRCSTNFVTGASAAKVSFTSRSTSEETYEADHKHPFSGGFLGLMRCHGVLREKGRDLAWR